MKETITRLFDKYADAARAVDSLKRSGFEDSDISIVANRESYADTETDSESEAGSGAGIGGALGAGVGLLAGLGIMAIPGLGPVVAAGWFAATAAGAAAGAVGGGVLGAMVDAGVPEQDAHVYAEGIRRGGTLVSVRTELPDDAQRILDSYASVNIQNRRSQLADSGWQNFNDPSRP